MQNVTDTVRRFIVDDLGWEGSMDDLTDDLPLIQSGTLDSLGIVTLVEFLESNYGITVEDKEIVSAHLGSLANIEQYVKSKQADCSLCLSTLDTTEAERFKAVTRE
jgi:acyl carrier protein